jgi:hypothetical protein
MFYLYLAELRDLAAFAEEIALLLMDNCWAYVMEEVIHLLTEASGASCLSLQIQL